MQLNGRKTIEEDIADNIGLKAAYDAYQSWRMKNREEVSLPKFEKYTPNQMFWLSYAQSFYCSKYSQERLKEIVADKDHTVDEFRVIGSLSNRPEFAKDFNCPSGSKMNPLEKCFLFES